MFAVLNMFGVFVTFTSVGVSSVFVNFRSLGCMFNVFVW